MSIPSTEAILIVVPSVIPPPALPTQHVGPRTSEDAEGSWCDAD
jgi:hypothetical protein